jgi:osmotically-inducible protein OsmY
VKKWAAEDATHQIRDVKAVANDIEVHLPGASERTDPDLAKAVNTALKEHSSVPSDQLDITVSKGWVTRKGEAPHEYSGDGRAFSECLHKRNQGQTWNRRNM